MKYTKEGWIEDDEEEYNPENCYLCGKILNEDKIEGIDGENFCPKCWEEVKPP